MDFRFTNHALKQFQEFEKEIQNTLIKKLNEIKTNTYWDFKKVTGLFPATHRLRIGNYRLLLKKEIFWFIVLKIGHRKDIYK